jgi:type IV secretion system protein TrbC
MRESLRRCGPWLFRDPRDESTTNRKPGTHHSVRALRWRMQVSRIAAVLTAIVVLLPSAALAQQSPWERAATNLEQTFTGPLARSLALVAIVIGGLMFMFGEGGAKRQISGIVFGGGLALFAAQFLTWLF